VWKPERTDRDQTPISGQSQIGCSTKEKTVHPETPGFDPDAGSTAAGGGSCGWDSNGWDSNECLTASCNLSLKT
jgi:hypothetical protein